MILMSYTITNMLRIGELRHQVENARKITEEQKVILDKIRHVHRFFQGLETVCDVVNDVSIATLRVGHHFFNEAIRFIRISKLLRPPCYHSIR